MSGTTPSVWGGVDKGAEHSEYRFFVPEMKIIIDGKVFDPRS